MVQECHHIHRRTILLHHVRFLLQEGIAQERQLIFILEKIRKACGEDVCGMVGHHITCIMALHRMGTSRLLVVIENSLFVQDVFVLWELWHLLVSARLNHMQHGHLLFRCKEKARMVVPHCNSSIHSRSGV